MSRKSKRFSYSAAIIIALAALVLPAPPAAYAGEVTLGWDPNTEEDLAGYKIYYGLGSRDYSEVVDVGNVTEYTVTGLQEGATYYFAATAYDLYGNESGYSDEVSHHFTVLVALEVIGAAELDEEGGAQYTCTATYSDGSTSDVTAGSVWSENSAYASIDVAGYLTASAVPSDQACRVTASYTFGSVTLSDYLDVIIRDVPPVLVGLSITGPMSVDDESGAQYACTAAWSDGSTSDVTAGAAWSENSAYATIGTGGYLTTLGTIGDQACRITVSYTSGEVTETAALDVSIIDTGDEVSPAAPTGFGVVN